MGSGHDKSCGFYELLVFCGALVAGTGCSLTSKVLLGMHSIGITGEVEPFERPLFQTLAMFVGMLAALVMHFLVRIFKIPFPGYNHKQTSLSKSGRNKTYNAIPSEASHDDDDDGTTESLPLWMYFILVIPAMFDLAATALCMFGLLYVNVSAYQMLRGSAIVFVAILKHTVLGDKLLGFMWVGVFWNVVSIILVGLTAMYSADSGEDSGEHSSKALFGVALILCGAFVQSLQYAFEEKVMSMDIAAPPLLLIGMEGFWGTVVCAGVLYPVVYSIPGDDHGSYENPWNTWAMLQNSREVQVMFTLYFLSVFFYNMLAVLVTFMLNSVWHAILDNFRPITVWATDLFIFYVITATFGENWTKWSYMQLLGMFVLLYGTAVYNAPNAGSIKLTGGLKHLFMDFSEEYDRIEEQNKQPGAHSSLTPIPFSPYLSPLAASPALRRTRRTNDV